MYRADLLLHARRWRVEDYAEALPRVTPERLAAFVPRLLGRARLEALVVGNASPDDARAVAADALEALRAGCL